MLARALFVLSLGIVVGYALARISEKSPPPPPPATTTHSNYEETPPALTPQEVEEYHQLKEMKAQYEEEKEISERAANETQRRDERQAPQATAPARSAPSYEQPRSEDKPTPTSSAASSTTSGSIKIAPFTQIEAQRRFRCNANVKDWSYSIQMAGDYQVSVNQPQTAHISAVKDQPRGEARISNCAEASSFGGRVRMTAWVKADGVRDYADIYIRVEGSDRRRRLEDERKPIKGTSGWKLHSIEADIPAGGTFINFGAKLEGRGSLEIRNVKLSPAPME